MRIALIFGLLLLPLLSQAQESTLTVLPKLSEGFQRNFNPFRSNVLATTNGFIFEPLFIVDELWSNLVYRFKSNVLLIFLGFANAILEFHSPDNVRQ